jgi:hypothetical protein
MADGHEQTGSVATQDQPSEEETGGHEQTGGPATQDQPSDEDRSEIGQRAAYEAELNRITSSEMILQTAVSLLNIGGRRLGLAGQPTSPAGPAAAAERDLEQVRDAIDGASALLPILERRMPRELGPLRDAVAQLQVAYAREASASASQSPPAGTAQANDAGTNAPAPAKDAPGAPAGGKDAPASGKDAPAGDEASRPGPAQASGRLWVPGR